VRAPACVRVGSVCVCARALDVRRREGVSSCASPLSPPVCVRARVCGAPAGACARARVCVGGEGGARRPVREDDDCEI
jgi:hypothetical protein